MQIMKQIGAGMLAVSLAFISAGASAAPAPDRASGAIVTPQGANPQADRGTTGERIQLAQRRRGIGRRGARGGRGFRGGRRAFRGRAFRGPRWRGRRWSGRRWRGRSRGRNIGAGVAGFILGSILANGVRARGRRSAWERCDDAYKTFSWDDGTYIPYVGSPRVLCPYLR